MRKRKSKHNSRHHINPRSVGGDFSPENIVRVNSKKHEAYHILFDNRRPDEIIERLVNNYWNGQWDWVRDAYERNNQV